MRKIIKCVNEECGYEGPAKGKEWIYKGRAVIDQCYDVLCPICSCQTTLIIEMDDIDKILIPEKCIGCRYLCVDDCKLLINSDECTHEMRKDAIEIGKEHRKLLLKTGDIDKAAELLKKKYEIYNIQFRYI